MSVYKITHPNYNNEYYIGSTKGTLKDRLYQHKNHSKYTDKYKSKLYDIMRVEDNKLFKIELIETCDDKSLIKQREQYYIKNETPSWNTIKSYRTADERREYEKIRQRSEKVRQYKKEWYKKNKNKVIDNAKLRNENNIDFKEHRREYMRNYRKNKKAILTK